MKLLKMLLWAAMTMLVYASTGMCPVANTAWVG